jgi:hypothetical protein
MSGTRFGLTRLVFGVVPLVLAFLLSAFVVPGAAAQTNACALQLVSSATFPITGYGGPWGTVTLSKYLDGCGNEQGVLSANVYNATITGGAVSISGVIQVNNSSDSSYLATPVEYVGSGSGPVVCGGISVGAYETGGGGGGCTPN